MSAQLSPQDLQMWLEWAGARMIAMPGGRTKPSEPHVIWPEYSQDKFEILDFRKDNPLRASGPSKDEIPIMDEILTLPRYCTDPFKRRVLQSRALVHPISGRNIYSWNKIARRIGRDPKTVRTWHSTALQEVCNRAPQASVCRIRAFLYQS